MRDKEEHLQCVARPLLFALSSEDLKTALSDIDDDGLRNLFQVLGLRVPPGRLRSAKHSLVASRLRSLTPSAAHVAAMELTVAGMSPMLDAVNSSRGAGDDTPLRKGVARLRQEWSPPLMKLLVTVMSEVGMIGQEEFGAVMSLIDEGETGPPSSGTGLNGTAVDEEEGRVETEPGGSPGPSEAPDGHRPPKPTRPPRPTGPAELARLVLEAAGAGTALDVVLVPSVVAGDGEAAGPAGHLAAAVDELVSVRPTEPGSWFLRGMIDAHGGAATATAPSPSNQDLNYFRFLGAVTVLAGRVQAGHSRPVTDLLEGDRRAVERVVGSTEGAYLSAFVLVSLLEADPRWAAELLSRVPLPFADWGTTLAALRRRAATLVEAGDMITAELLLRSADEALSSWILASEEAIDDLGDEMQAEAAELCLLRVTCRRARRDFNGAARLMTELPDKLLSPAGQVSAACERALIAAEVADIADLRFPRTGRERRSMVVRLERARRPVDELLESDPDNLVARLLSGMHAVCIDDDAAAARHLGLAESLLVERGGGGPLVAGTRFHRALCQLRLLEPGTCDSAYRQLAGAVDDGYEPVPAWLVAAAEALDVHESPLVAEAISLAASAAPSDPTVTAMVCAHARRGVPVVVELAQRLGADRARSLSSRFELLEAALEGTRYGGGRVLVEDLVGEIDDVVGRASEPALDERWATLLGRHEGLRLLLDPLHADLLRIDVLRRVGRIEEARELAGRVFYRVAAGGVIGVDAGDVLELLAQLGAGEEELGSLRPLLGPTAFDEQRPPRLEREVRIVFVGGNETQERYQESIAAALAERYGGSAVVEWFIPGWGSNWMKEFSRIESRFEDADAVVLMAYVRTLFGRRLRKTAGEAGLPWVACTGHGRDALLRAIERAIAVVAG